MMPLLQLVSSSSSSSSSVLQRQMRCSLLRVQYSSHSKLCPLPMNNRSYYGSIGSISSTGSSTGTGSITLAIKKSWSNYSTTSITPVTTTSTKSDEPLPETGEWKDCRRTFMAPLRIKNVRGTEILHNPLYNKGTAFKSGERDRLGFRGLLPAKIMNIKVQKERFLLALRSEESNIKKNILLEDLHDRNETLYHRVMIDHMDEMAPYTNSRTSMYGIRNTISTSTWYVLY
jgi:hypothetical protein